LFHAIKRLSGQTLVYGLGHVVTRLVWFMLLPFFTHYLPPEQFGEQTLFYILIAVMMEVVRLGQDIALLRYYVLEKIGERRKAIFSTIFWGMLFFSTAIAGAIWYWDGFWVELFVGYEAPFPEWTIVTLHLCAVIVFLDNLSAFPLVVMRGENKAGLFLFAKLAGVIVQTGLTLIFLVWMGRGIQGIFEANAISAAVTLIICLPTIFSRLKLKFDKAIIIACLAFGLPNLPNSLFVQVIELADRKILALLRSTAEVGIYSAGYKLGLFLSIVAMGFRYAWQPFFLQISDRSDAQEVYARVFTYYMAITFWLYLLLTAFVEPITTWNFPVIGYIIAPDYWQGLKIFPVILLAQVFNGAYAVFMVGMYLKKKMYVLPFITGAAALVNVAINVALVPQHGMWASAWATVAAYATMTILLYVYVNRRYPISWEWKRILHLLLTGALIYAASAIGKQYGMNWISYIGCLLYPFILVITGLATPGELAHLKTRNNSG